MTPEQIEIIKKVINRIAHKYVFGPYEIEDIKQEAFIFALEAIEKWDGSRPLENFLAIVLPNKLKNFKRQKYFRLGVSEKYAKINESKKNLMDMAQYHDQEEEYSVLFAEKISSQEAVDMILESLPLTVRADFLRLANGVPLSKVRREKVYELVKEILKGKDW